MKKLTLYLDNLERNISSKCVSDLKKSKANIAWHIDHCLKVINGISKFLKTSNPEDYQYKFNLKKVIVMTLGIIPRGKAKAPSAVQSLDKINVSDLQLQLKNARISIHDLELLKADSNFKHPYFGYLKTKEAIRFLEIHTYHHIKIINDILGYK